MMNYGVVQRRVGIQFRSASMTFHSGRIRGGTGDGDARLYLDTPGPQMQNKSFYIYIMDVLISDYVTDAHQSETSKSLSRLNTFQVKSTLHFSHFHEHGQSFRGVIGRLQGQTFAAGPSMVFVELNPRICLSAVTNPV